MTNDALINMNKVQKRLNEMADNARDNGYPHDVEVIQSVQDNLLDFVEESRAALAPVDGNTSDGYHTFNELYEHRHALFLTICKIYKDRAWKSKFHSDGTMFDGWFIAGIATTDGQATYHLPLRLWDDFTVNELPMAPPWDGHTPDDVINRIKSLAARGCFGVPEGYALVPVSVIKFLNGEDKLEGCSFGERPLGATGMYWWRKYLKAAPKKEGV